MKKSTIALSALVLTACLPAPATIAQSGATSQQDSQPYTLQDSQQGSQQTQQNTQCGPSGCMVPNDEGNQGYSQSNDAGQSMQYNPGQVNSSGTFQNGNADAGTTSTAMPNETNQPGNNGRMGQPLETPVGGQLPRQQPPRTAMKPGEPLPGQRTFYGERSEFPQPLSDFQKFVEANTGVVLPIFGSQLFENRPSDFAASTSVSAPEDYIVGPGDQLKVRAWGNVSMDVSARVDRDGQIFLPQVGAISVAGLRQDQLQETVRAAMAREFRKFDLSVSLGQLRSIQVLVLGQAQRPGVYTISSLSTLVNALFDSGGPSPSGTLRDIQVKRNGKVITHLDVYELLLHGDRSHDVHMLPGDIIYIPYVGPQIAITGEVQNPAIYELKASTTADEALKLAGGLTPVAGEERASLDRILDHSKRTVQDFPLNGPQQLITMQNGDVLRVFPISPRVDQAVTLSGFVGEPGRYAWHPGMRVSDLIPSRRFLLTRRYYNQQNALTPKIQDHPFTAARPEPQQSALHTRALSNAEAAAAANTPDLLQNVQNADLASHETEINWNYASIERLGNKDLTTHMESFDLGRAVDDPSSSDNKTLEPGDVVVIYSVRDINLPTELRARFVRIDGEVAKPGIYRVEGNETLRDLVERAGGLGPHAYPYAAQLTRESVRLAEDAKLRSLIQLESQAALSPVNATPTADGRGNESDLAMRKAYLDVLRQIHSTGRVVLQLSPDIHTASQLPAFALQDGDHFFVPTAPNTVDVLGSVYNQGSLRYVSGQRVHDYLRAAGDHTRLADQSHDFVLRADGTVLSREKTSRFGNLVLYPGDSIVVPGKFKGSFNLYQLMSISQVLSGFALSALAVNALP